MALLLRRRYSCPVELSLDMLGGKWKTVILAHLKERPLRYGELRGRMPSLTDKVLTERLTDLCVKGLIARRKNGGRGASSRYELTPRGHSLRPVLQALYEWGERVAPEVGAVIDPESRSAVG